MNLAGEPVRRQPLAHRIRIEEGAIDFLGSGAEHTVQTDGVGGPDGFQAG